MADATGDEQLANALELIRSGYFSADGRACDFAALVGSPAAAGLRGALSALATFDPRPLPIPGPLAFWLNAYNAAALCAVLDAGLPARVRDAPGYFTAPRVHVAGLDYSLDDIEHGLLRGNVAPYGRLRAPLSGNDPRKAFTPRLWDERVHFALHCACRSAPALRVFRRGSLAEDLEAAARAYLRSEVEAKPAEGELVLPRILKWYAGDFGGRGGVLAFVAARLDDDTSNRLIEERGRALALAYHGYDWTLNALRRRTDGEAQ